MACYYDSIDGNSASGSNDRNITDLNFIDWYSHFFIITAYSCHLGGKVQQIPDASAGLVKSIGFQCARYGHNEHDDCCRPELTNCNGGNKSNRDEYIDGYLSVKDILESRKEPQIAAEQSSKNR